MTEIIDTNRKGIGKLTFKSKTTVKLRKTDEDKGFLELSFLAFNCKLILLEEISLSLRKLGVQREKRFRPGM